MNNTDQIEISDINTSSELSSEEMNEVKGGGAKISTDSRTGSTSDAKIGGGGGGSKIGGGGGGSKIGGGGGGSKTSGITGDSRTGSGGGDA